MLLGFWRGQRLGTLEQGLKPGRKYEMATLEFREVIGVPSKMVRRLTNEAVALHMALGDPTKVVQNAKS
ncbi:MAG: hypothetical protein NT142_02990 [Planctomycetota bacterium]|nr:hypothetical protein [Planctomycetota bacterium]